MYHIFIDSSHKRTYSGLLSGQDNAIYKFRESFLDTYRELGINPKYHWNDLTRKKRAKLKEPLLSMLGQSQGIHLNIFTHKRPLGIREKEWCLNRISNEFCRTLEPWVHNKWGHLELVVDRDYEVVKGGKGTEQFIESILRQLAIRCTGKDATVRHGRNLLKMDIKQNNGRVLKILGGVAPKGSEWITMVDAYLGMYASDGKVFGVDNVYVSKVE